MLLSHAKEAAEAEHRVSDVPAELIDHEALDGADLAAIGTADRGAFDPVAGNQAMGLASRRVGLHSCLHRSFRVRQRFGRTADAGFRGQTLWRPAPFRRSEQRRHHAHLKRPEENRAVGKPNRERHRRLAFEHGPLAERRDQAGRGALARDPPEPGHQPIESVERCPDLSFRHDALDVEHLEKLFDADDGHLEIAVETAAWAELEDACANRALVISIWPSRACHSLNRTAQGLGEMSFTPRSMAAMSASIGLAVSGWNLSATAASSRSAISTSGLSAVDPGAWRPCSSNRCARNMLPLAAMLGSRTVGATSASDARSTPDGSPRTLA